MMPHFQFSCFQPKPFVDLFIFLLLFFFGLFRVNLSAEFVFLSVETLIESPFSFLSLVCCVLLSFPEKNKMEEKERTLFLPVGEELKITIIVSDVTTATSLLEEVQ